MIGTGVEGLSDELASYGADKVHVFDDAALASYATEAYARGVAQVIDATKPSSSLVLASSAPSR